MNNNNKIFATALKDFAKAAANLTDAWNNIDEETSERVSKIYPFTQSFDDLNFDIKKWADDCKTYFETSQPVTGKRIFLWHDKTGKEVSTQVDMKAINAYSEDENFNGLKLIVWATEPELIIGDDWENATDHYTCIQL